jgi:Tyrosine phosphatase family
MRATASLADQTVASPRTVILNFRDFGGIPTVDGRRVAPGRLFRSGAPFGTEAWRCISELGVRLVCDLRSPAERGDPPYPGGQGPRGSWPSTCSPTNAPAASR